MNCNISRPHCTAISRKTLPLPTRWLMENGYLWDDFKLNILDFGCGKCHKINQTHFKYIHGFDSWDKYDQTDVNIINETEYDIIICNYVLCVVPPEERLMILKTLQNKLKKYGRAFISVRNDKPDWGYGMSKRGTYQGRCAKLNLVKLHECSQFRIYLLTKTTNLG